MSIAGATPPSPPPPAPASQALRHPRPPTVCSRHGLDVSGLESDLQECGRPILGVIDLRLTRRKVNLNIEMNIMAHETDADRATAAQPGAAVRGMTPTSSRGRENDRERDVIVFLEPVPEHLELNVEINIDLDVDLDADHGIQRRPRDINIIEHADKPRRRPPGPALKRAPMNPASNPAWRSSEPAQHAQAKHLFMRGRLEDCAAAILNLKRAEILVPLKLVGPTQLEMKEPRLDQERCRDRGLADRLLDEVGHRRMIAVEAVGLLDRLASSRFCAARAARRRRTAAGS